VAGREIIKMKGTQKGLLEFDADEFVGVPPSLIGIRAGSEVGWILLRCEVSWLPTARSLSQGDADLGYHLCKHRQLAMDLVHR
jgi:hypothetical protein